MFCLSKNKLHRNQKTKNNVILGVGNVYHVQQDMHSLFSLCLMQPDEEFLLMYAGCFYTCSSETPKDRNPVAIDLGIKGATSFKTYCDHQRIRSTSALLNLLYAP
jgi:hypothetical protein